MLQSGSNRNRRRRRRRRKEFLVQVTKRNAGLIRLHAVNELTLEDQFYLPTR
jgi:hypothetical protein